MTAPSLMAFLAAPGPALATGPIALNLVKDDFALEHHSAAHIPAEATAILHWTARDPAVGARVSRSSNGTQDEF